MALIVKKFGGSSVKDAEHVMNVAGIVVDEYKSGNDVIVVVSAQGAFSRRDAHHQHQDCQQQSRNSSSHSHVTFPSESLHYCRLNQYNSIPSLPRFA